MNKFITLHYTKNGNNQTLCFQSLHIINLFYNKNEEYTTVYTTRSSYIVNETPEQILALINSK